MCSNEQQEPAEILQKPSQKDFAAIKLVMYGSVVAFTAGIMVGCSFIEPLAIAAVIGVLASWAVGIFVVAPRAGHIAKAKIMRTLSNPTEDEAKMLAELSMNILANTSAFAEHDEAKKLFRPIVGACMGFVDESIDKSMANIASQASKGVGAFAEEGDKVGFVREIVTNVAFPVVDDLLDSVHATDDFKKKVHFKMLSKISSLPTDGGSLSPNTGGYMPSGGK